VGREKEKTKNRGLQGQAKEGKKKCQKEVGLRAGCRHKSLGGGRFLATKLQWKEGEKKEKGGARLFTMEGWLGIGGWAKRTGNQENLLTSYHT